MNAKMCTLDGCGLPHRAKGYCEQHYRRWRRNGDPGPVDIRTVDPNRRCSVNGCDRPYASGGYCSAHYQQVQDGKVPGMIRRAPGSTLERDAEGRKWCSSGKHWTDVSAFAVDGEAPDGLGRRCTECIKLRKFGLSREQYAAMLAAQGGGCAICGGTNPNGNALSVDHDHACCPGKRCCGKCVRGLLCAHCNMGIGHLADSAQRLRDAARYLDSHAT